MNFKKRNIKRVIDSFLIDTKDKGVGTDDPWSMSIICSRNDENIKEEPNIAATTKLEERFIFKENLEDIFDSDSLKLIYASPQACHDLSTLFKCSNKTAKSSIKYPRMPCTCENCALISIIRDSQKITFASEVIPCPQNEVTATNRDSEKEKRNKTPSKEEEYDHYRKLLNRIKELEERLKVQEETTVPKAAFRQLLTKLVTSITANEAKQKANISRQCPKTYVKHCENCRQTYSLNSRPLLVSEDCPGSSKQRKPRLCDKKTSPIATNYHVFWKWGEEILKPGIDIKNKIKVLLEDAIKKIPIGVGKPDDNSKSFITNTFNYIFHNDTKNPVMKNAHHSDTSLKISYINPHQWKESDSSLNSSASDFNLSETSHSLKNTHKEKFIRILKYSSQGYKQRLWNAVWKQCLIYGYDKRHTATIHFPFSRGNNNLDNILVKFTIGELEDLLTGKKAGTI